MRKNILNKIIDGLDSELKGFCRIKHKIGWLDFLKDGEMPFTPKKLHETLWSIIDTPECRPRGNALFNHHRRYKYAAKADKVPKQPEDALERFIVVSNDKRFYNQIPIGGRRESIDIGIAHTNSKFILVELKAWKSKYSPLYAVIEALKNLVEYRVIIEREIKVIKEYNEMNLTVLAPETYYNRYGLTNHCGKIEHNKLSHVKGLLNDLSEEFQVGMSFMALSLSYDEFLPSCRKAYDRCGIFGKGRVKVSKKDKISSLNRENWKNLVSSDQKMF